MVRKESDENLQYLLELYNEHHTAFKHAAERVLHDESRTEDAVQEAIKRLLQRKVDLKKIEPSKCILYVIRTVINIALDMQKKDKNVLYVPDITATSDLRQQTVGGSRSDDPFDVLIQMELKQRIDATLSELPKRDQNLILCRHEYDMTYPELAEELGLNAPNARSAVSRACKRFRKKWREGERNDDE